MKPTTMLDDNVFNIIMGINSLKDDLTPYELQFVNDCLRDFYAGLKLSSFQITRLNRLYKGERL